jgi:hypothetical protein
MELPHWLMVVGAILLVVGFVGSSLRKNEMVASEPDDWKGEQKSEAQEAP